MTCFLALADHGVIDHELARRLVAAAGFRNLVARQYGTVDTNRLFAMVSADLDDLLAFCRALARQSRPKSDA